MRIGHGFDVHRLVPDRSLVIGGVTIPWQLGLLGHSDADVLLHAVCDAMLGALGLGDIGRHFPDSDPAYKGIDSTRLLAHVVTLASRQGYRVGNLDATVVAQQPRLAPHIPAMVARIAATCQVEAARINVKATTTEQLGYTGRGEGIAAHAVVLMEQVSPLT
jgi:2-C-methyl-D-erythritol 2,4-cyclodiphosphate synthase